MEEDNGESKPDEMFQDQVAEKTIRIYPNPTKGDLKVEISGYEERDSGTLMLFSMSGQLLMTADITAEINDLNLSNLPDGMYILRISLNGDDSVWRIIKD
ncbi:MAG: T9SS type A sorting domain-containing protein [Bacteroides sp.]|nr:T9SS type A sorting domain-containing protein [Bacteroides sp.]